MILRRALTRLLQLGVAHKPGLTADDLIKPSRPALFAREARVQENVEGNAGRYV